MCPALFVHRLVVLFYGYALLNKLLHQFLVEDGYRRGTPTSTYSLGDSDDAVKNSVAAEAIYAYLDLGPVDTLDQAIL